MAVQTEGTIAFWLFSPRAEWHSDSLKYEFGPYTFGDLSVSATKLQNRKLVVRVVGPFAHPFELSGKTPRPGLDPEGKPGVHVALTWRFPSVKLFLGGQQVDEQTIVAH